ncbi:putative WRKY transcription factor 69 [Morella rubra]|uniref:Putative WRKY transcription factor 69 n=1 Tax=Morella rubra TaxID=262757 RepID=A0A6A1VAE4_9ROSI|nr:putative WRKY transcription factor 69 [Morella rubra]
MLVITYACDHNHPAATTKHHSSASAVASSSSVATLATTDPPAKLHPEELVVFANDHDLALGGDSSPLLDERFLWFADIASTNFLESPICEGISCCSDVDVAMVFSMGEDEESLFADLGELPECSVVFRRSFVKPDEQNRRCNLSVVSCYNSAS